MTDRDIHQALKHHIAAINTALNPMRRLTFHIISYYSYCNYMGIFSSSLCRRDTQLDTTARFSDDLCVVCLESRRGAKTALVPCGHQLCAGCASNMRNHGNRCPCCRTPIVMLLPRDDKAADVCKVCSSPRDPKIALHPCGHQRLCGCCAKKLFEQGYRCPNCNTPIFMLIPLY